MMRSSLSVIVFQPWGIGDLLMSARPMWFLKNKADIEVSVVTPHAAVGELLIDLKFIDSYLQMRWTSNRFINLFFLLKFSIFNARKYSFILIPAATHPLVSRILRLFNENTLVADEIQGQFDKKSRIIRNIYLAKEFLKRVGLMTLSNCDMVHEFNKYIAKTYQQEKSLMKVGVFMGASMGLKAAPIDVIRHVCVDLLENGFNIYEITDSYHLLDFDSDSVHYLPRMSLAQLTNYFIELGWFVVGDTGLAHLADLFGVRVILLSGPTHAEDSKPLNSLIVRSHINLSCSPCYGTTFYKSCPHNNLCMQSIEPKHVVQKILSA